MVVNKLALSGQIFENYSSTKFMKIHQVGAELFHMDGQAGGQGEVTKL
jgi:hypothetical protein